MQVNFTSAPYYLREDNWSCAYCVSSGVTGHKVEARTRRRAAAAVREMTRLKHEIEPQESDEDVEMSPNDNSQVQAKQPPAIAVGTEKDDVVLQEERASTRKRKIDDENMSEIGDTAEGRRRRPRRQPTLYDPQACAASAWQSDGISEWKALGYERGISRSVDGDDEENASEGSEDSDEPAWCNFCHDNLSVSVCCFCACRVCFGKHDGVSMEPIEWLCF